MNYTKTIHYCCILSGGLAVAMSSEEPPTYEQATSQQPIQEQVAGRHERSQKFILEGCKIRSLPENPSTIAYELSAAPRHAIAHAYDVYKLEHPVTSEDSKAVAGSRRDHIYSFKEKPAFSLGDPRQHVLIHGHSSRRQRTYKEVVLEGGFTGWSGCKSEGHFSAAIPFSQRFNSGVKHITWKDDNGKVVAVETLSPGHNDDEDDSSEEPSQLKIDTVLDPRDLDLLITCWVARLWKESKAKSYEKLPSSNCKFCDELGNFLAANSPIAKNFTSLRHRMKNTAKLGGSTMAASGTYF